MKYNEPNKKWEEFKRYAKSIQIGELTPLCGFKLYQKTSKKIDEDLVGLVTKNGIKVTGKSYHFISRIIGSVEQRRNGVGMDEIVQALTSPVSVSDVLVKDNGRSQRFRGEKIIVTINPDTGMLIQTNPARRFKA